MVTVKELRALAKSYELPGRTKFKKKSDLLRTIAEVFLTEDVEKPHKKGRRARE